MPSPAATASPLPVAPSGLAAPPDASATPSPPIRSSPSHALRLAPVARIRSVGVRLFGWLFRTQLGKVMTPITVLYARMPRLLWPQMWMARLAQKGLSIDSTLANLLQTRVSVLNGCTFCSDLHRALALREGDSAAKLAALGDAETLGAGTGGTGAFAHAGFTPREVAALAFADEITRRNEATDETFAALRAAFDERQIVEILWLCSFTAYTNRMARTLGIGSDGFCALAPRP